MHLKPENGGGAVLIVTAVGSQFIQGVISTNGSMVEAGYAQQQLVTILAKYSTAFDIHQEPA